jgi:type IV pilus assembly protein PilN
MMQINLLPWREQARQIQKRRFMAGSILSVIIAILLVIMGHVYLSSFAREQNYINETLQRGVNDEQAAVNATNSQQKEKTHLEGQLKFIISLYNNNNGVLRFLNEISTIVPGTISLNKIIRTGKIFTLAGYAASDGDVTDFMSILKKSPIVIKAVLNKITAGMDINNSRRNFEILVEEKDEPGDQH